MPTIAEDSTQQQIFDYVVAHLYKQGRRSVDIGGCRYRSSEGLSCAVGCLMTDEEYRSEFEQRVASSRMIYGLGGVFKQTPLLMALQQVHDAAILDSDKTFNLESLGQGLQLVADRFNLTFEVPNHA